MLLSLEVLPRLPRTFNERQIGMLDLPPAHLGVSVLEGGGENGADVGHVDEHQRDPDQSIQHGHQLAEVRARSQVAVAWGGDRFKFRCPPTTPPPTYRWW